MYEMSKWFLLIIVLTNGCSDHQKLKGNWHLEPSFKVTIDMEIGDLASKKEEFAFIDFYDEHGVWNKNHHHSGIFVKIDSYKKTMRVSNSECYLMEYSYEINNDSMKLFNDEQELQYVGFKCELNCCDKQEDEFLNIGLKIDLPIEPDTIFSTTFIIDPIYSHGIYIGSFKSGNELILSTVGQFLTIEDFEWFLTEVKVSYRLSCS